MQELYVRDEKSALELFNSAFCLQDYRLTKIKDGNASGINKVEKVDFKNIAIYRVESIDTITSSHTRKHILAELNRDFVLSIPLSHRYYVMKNGKQSVCDPGFFRLLSLSVPFSTHTSGIQPSNRSYGYVARISGPMLRQLIPDIDDYPDLVLKIRPGVGNIMRSLVMTGLSEGEHLTTSQARDFGKTIINSIVNAVVEAPEFEKQKARTPLSSQSRICETAMEFIERNLSNPTLDCTLVASHCQVSTTYLHVAFASSSMKVGSYIRELRLQNCRANLLDPKLRHRTVTEIMTNWGFTNLSSFGQAYKTRFGKKPTEERNSSMNQALAG